ncbi:MAG: pyrimidine dimer DNA glycosylase/endonuclease V [Nitrososphaerales archaeon]
MRLWSIHPKYLDSRGLVALWREGLLAKRVLEGKTRGYVNHPQLIRFKLYDKPIELIDAYLTQIYYEAEKRGYLFDYSKIRCITISKAVSVTCGQLKYEFKHLLEKLKKRDVKRFEELKRLNTKFIKPNPIFRVVEGGIESWERVE